VDSIGNDRGKLQFIISEVDLSSKRVAVETV